MRESDTVPSSEVALPTPRGVWIAPATREHLPAIQGAYAYARTIQRWGGATVWPEFTETAILIEIEGRRLYRVMDDGELAGVFSIAYADPAIWGALENGRHVYLHRIARSSGDRGGGLTAAVLTWARAHSRALGRAGLRLDTWAQNNRLVGYYVRHGFHVVGRRRIGIDPRLPAGYHGQELALLEQHLTV
jgi:ribosomal protein S18 acetylase RimI-like enzyme